MTGMHVAYDLSFAHTEGRWALADGSAGITFPDLAGYRQVAIAAERAGVDLLFFGDGSGVPSTWRGSIDAAVEWGIQWPRHDMAPVIAVLSTATRHIGFGLTYSSTFMHPFTVARLLNSLDHVTGGRIAFNVVASTRGSDAANHGADHLMDHDLRYERMEEFVSVCRALWDSVEPDAIVRDVVTGRFADPRKVHPIHHEGRFFSVRGPLASVPSPQRHPPIVQAGASPRGIAASASFADLVFGFGPTVTAQQRHRAALDRALVDVGRDPAEVGILWATQAIVAPTTAGALAERDELLRFWNPEAVGVFLSHNSGYDFSTLPASFRLGELHDEIRAAQASPAGFVGGLVDELGPAACVTREEFFERGRRAAAGLDHMVVGDAETVADTLQETFDAVGGPGGFMLSSPLGAPGGFDRLSELLMPALRSRGALAPRYPGATLRENLALRT
ncbi:FMN-dependent oxidoreductase, nitrilotriacetate monooxygenase family [Quadrisphaera granulorum]|uniref:FMN-dependent oxidoreductase (Nitrilotriacetate monooxygenase family) n=1 Tax=Quadrisphaera granulorum TaxID=317664 RepID=A0A316A847_9ACTN|nr:NtaA/DmoA family FMN-dependent monooxygenase [Quadrisphaera granulorum]PWJ53619.1 FMN-dependent oxidoreductase (nitrilotriacetate monooxygenase family) [Quadrisphaera granulorum]SZE96663.1 FMN-dependent oxidoreductase, nitrilotriacetate monooxygenase family [Quadrisphaera granulorum]